MKGRRILRLVAVLGIGLLAVTAILILRTRSFLANGAHADGQVVEIVWQSGGDSDTAHPRVRFQTANHEPIEFLSNVGSNPPSFRVGDPVRVVYDPANPTKASINSIGQLWFPAMICGGSGLVLLAIGAGPALWSARASRRDEWLRANGRPIQATVERVELYSDYVVGGESPYRIICQAHDPYTNQTRTFYSRHIWYDPTKYVTSKTIDVIIDPNNPKRYVVNTDFLPKLDK